ncbi:MAG: acriflavin resistance protein [SAR86 cluster bacterium]|uniref:Acriflavin resistance protein n=1 Tax=SAR86 cluster bacterium TaxID=2030880 RepID=A0A2A4X0X6_9GAMM|nr:MAG: acriflavin resistance protein [SAR86 cluster bacterium]
MSASNNIINLFTNHKVASNLVMIMMILSGLWAADRINTQLDPSVEFPVIVIQANWPGASAEDIEQLIVVPVEQQIANMPDLESYRSFSRNGSATIVAVFYFDSDISKNLNFVKNRVTQIRNFPADMEPIQISQEIDYEEIAVISVSSDGSLQELMPLVREMEDDLYARGIEEIRYDGMPEEEIAIQVSSSRLLELDTNLEQIASEVRQRSANSPAGTVGRGQAEMQLRSLDQKREVSEFEQMQVAIEADGRLARLTDIATIEKRPKVGQPALYREGKVAIEMELYRLTSSDAIDTARIVNEWIAETEPNLPRGVEIHKYQEAWLLLKEQLRVIFENGTSGLILVLVTLFLFLNGRVGWWVMMGIPVSFLFATLIFYGVFGGSINIVALIAFIMALGIVVDDAIVVSEDAVTLFEQGMSPSDAAANGAKRMLLPVLTSSMTTLAAFVPLILAGGEMGAIITTIPMVMLCVIIASLIECFLVLPGHLRHAFENTDRNKPSAFRQKFDSWFYSIRENYYQPLLNKSLAAPGTTLCAALACVILSISLIAGGRVGLNLVTGMSLEMLEANVKFSAQASEADRQDYMLSLEQELERIDAENGATNINGYISKTNSARLNQERKTGSQYSSISIEYGWEEDRSIPPQEFVNLWQAAVQPSPLVEELYLEVRGGANNGRPDLTLILRGRDIPTLKQASEELQDALAAYPGVSNVYDNLPYGKDQIIYSINSAGKSLGITTESLGRQLRAAYNGGRVQIFNQNDSELEVSVMLPDDERDSLHSLKQFPIQTPSGELVAMGLIADIENRSGIDLINHNNGFMSVAVSASVDPLQNNTEQVVAHVTDNALSQIREKYNLTSGLGGVSRQNQELLDTLKTGAILTVIFIYLILAWSFSSYIWPLAVMTAIPLGLTGAIVGHWVMGVDIGAMSLLAFFSLTGIVVNDSIILVSFFRRELASGKPYIDAIHDASISRFRAVILTSLTTIAGLGPLMFETFSLAMYIVPIAITLCFGLAFSTLLVLVVIPALLVMIENASVKLRKLSPFTRLGSSVEPTPGSEANIV